MTKLQPTYEIIEHHGDLIQVEWFDRVTDEMRQARPTATTADLIAAAAPRGAVEPNYMVTTKEDHHPKGWCHRCRPTEEEEARFWSNLREHWSWQLQGFGVTWQPDLRL